MSLRLLLAAFTFLAVSGCAHHGSRHEAAADPVASVPLEWPALSGERAHHDAFQNGAVKVGLISLAAGATLPAHAAPFPVLLTARSGAGTVTMGGVTHDLDPGHAVFLPAKLEHAVVAKAGEPLLIAVLAVKAGGAPAAAEGCEHHGH